MNVIDLSKKLRARRLRNKLSLSQLARRANTSVSALSRYENGWGDFELKTLNKIFIALGCEIHIYFRPLQSGPVFNDTPQVLRQIKYLFWDCKIGKRHLIENPVWIIERVIEFGTLPDVCALIHFYGKRLFLNYVSMCRFQSPKTRQFWLCVLEREGVSCTKRSFPREVTFY